MEYVAMILSDSFIICQWLMLANSEWTERNVGIHNSRTTKIFWSLIFYIKYSVNQTINWIRSRAPGNNRNSIRIRQIYLYIIFFKMLLIRENVNMCKQTNDFIKSLKINCELQC